ncbi:MAG: hypothetical protein ACJ8LG_06425 [Massilia sp.]
MSVTFNDILESSETLALGEAEIDWRNSVSRAYYAAFHRARNSAHFCPDNGHLRMGAHEALSNRYELHGKHGAKSISVVLQAMKRNRHQADYDLCGEFDRTLCSEQIAQCKNLVERLVSFDNANQLKSA